MSILSILSKLYEKALNSQLTEYFNHHFDVFLSAFRAQYGCQSTLLRVIEDWKQALDQNKYVAAILMDLSKAFGCLPHFLLLLKLKTYGLSKNALKLMASYLTNRKQCFKLGNLKDTNIWAIILVPLIMTLSRGHTGQIKRTVIMRWLWLPYRGNKVAPWRDLVFYDKILIFILVIEIVIYTGKSPLEAPIILWPTETVPYQLIL